MGGDQKSNIKTCGEILINIEENRKRRTFTFNCAFCETSCDQLKKFSLHLDREHFQPIIEENVEMLDSDLELEEHLEDQTTNDSTNYLETSEHVDDTFYEDPLDTNENGELLDNIKIDIEVCSTDQHNDYEQDVSNDKMDDDYCVDENDENDDDYCVYENDDDDDEEEERMPTKKKKVSPKSKKKNIGLSNLITENSNNTRFAEKNDNVKKKRIRKKKSELDENVDEKEFITALLEAYEKHPLIWKPKERTVDKDITEKAFETISNEVNEKLNTSISWKFAKIRINALRTECSYELEKQRKGEEHHLPWYYEHMKYLQGNIEYMIRQRCSKFRSRVKYLDLSLLPVIIKLYKTYNDLWQVNNIHFGITVKRDEALNKIIEDLKLNHNIDITKDKLQDYIKYINLLYSKDKEQQLRCELENTEFTPSSQFYKKLLFLNESQGPFKCDTCNEIIQKYENYHMHVAKHNNTKPFKCPLCEMMEFKSFETYLAHARRHLNLSSLACDICGKIFSYRYELDLHLMIHTGEKPFLCQICGTRFRLHCEYDNHIRRHEKRYRYECHICKHGFNRLHTLKNHVKSHLQIRDIFCDICGKGFTASRYLNNHKLIHEDKKRYKCNVCGKEFSQGASFRTHRKQHQPHLSPAELKRKKESELNNLDCFDVKMKIK